MNDRSRMMLYALTAVACVIWQSAKEAMADGTMISTSNIIFLVCIGIAAVYCAVNALILWWRQPGKDDEDDNDNADESAESDESTKSDGSADSDGTTASDDTTSK